MDCQGSNGSNGRNGRSGRSGRQASRTTLRSRSNSNEPPVQIDLLSGHSDDVQQRVMYQQMLREVRLAYPYHKDSYDDMKYRPTDEHQVLHEFDAQVYLRRSTRGMATKDIQKNFGDKYTSFHIYVLPDHVLFCDRSPSKINDGISGGGFSRQNSISNASGHESGSVTSRTSNGSHRNENRYRIRGISVLSRLDQFRFEVNNRYGLRFRIRQHGDINWYGINPEYDVLFKDHRQFKTVETAIMQQQMKHLKSILVRLQGTYGQDEENIDGNNDASKSLLKRTNSSKLTQEEKDHLLHLHKEVTELHVRLAQNSENGPGKIEVKTLISAQEAEKTINKIERIRKGSGLTQSSAASSFGARSSRTTLTSGTRMYGSASSTPSGGVPSKTRTAKMMNYKCAVKPEIRLTNLPKHLDKSLSDFAGALVVCQVVPNSAAAKRGIMAGDMVLSINGIASTSMNWKDAVSLLLPGAPVQIYMLSAKKAASIRDVVKTLFPDEPKPKVVIPAPITPVTSSAPVVVKPKAEISVEESKDVDALLDRASRGKKEGEKTILQRLKEIYTTEVDYWKGLCILKDFKHYSLKELTAFCGDVPTRSSICEHGETASQCTETVQLPLIEREVSKALFNNLDEIVDLTASVVEQLEGCIRKTLRNSTKQIALRLALEFSEIFQKAANSLMCYVPFLASYVTAFSVFERMQEKSQIFQDALANFEKDKNVRISTLFRSPNERLSRYPLLYTALSADFEGFSHGNIVTYSDRKSGKKRDVKAECQVTAEMLVSTTEKVNEDVGHQLATYKLEMLVKALGDKWQYLLGKDVLDVFDIQMKVGKHKVDGWCPVVSYIPLSILKIELLTIRLKFNDGEMVVMYKSPKRRSRAVTRAGSILSLRSRRTSNGARERKPNIDGLKLVRNRSTSITGPLAEIQAAKNDLKLQVSDIIRMVDVYDIRQVEERNEIIFTEIKQGKPVNHTLELDEYSRAQMFKVLQKAQHAV